MDEDSVCSISLFKPTLFLHHLNAYRNENQHRIWLAFNHKVWLLHFWQHFRTIFRVSVHEFHDFDDNLRRKKTWMGLLKIWRDDWWRIRTFQKQAETRKIEGLRRIGVCVVKYFLLKHRAHIDGYSDVPCWIKNQTLQLCFESLPHVRSTLSGIRLMKHLIVSYLHRICRSWILCLWGFYTAWAHPKPHWSWNICFYRNWFLGSSWQKILHNHTRIHLNPFVRNHSYRK